jgi:hypothetical protein
MEPEDLIASLSEACALITSTQIKLDRTYGAEGYYLMHARQHIEKELDILVTAKLRES